MLGTWIKTQNNPDDKYMYCNLTKAQTSILCMCFSQIDKNWEEWINKKKWPWKNYYISKYELN